MENGADEEGTVGLITVLMFTAACWLTAAGFDLAWKFQAAAPLAGFFIAIAILRRG